MGSSIKLIFALVIFISGLTFFSCNTETTIKVSGELIGGVKDSLVFTNNLTTNTYQVLVNDSGKFTGEFPGEPGYYRLRTQSNQVLPGIQIYLKKNKVANFKIETNNWKREQKYAVLNNPESEYLRDLNTSNNNFYRKYNYNLRKLETSNFVSVIDSFRTEQNKNLEKFISENKKLDEDFKQVERERIRYNYAKQKESYALRKELSTLPDDYFDFRKELNYNDEKLLAISGVDYGMAVNWFITNESTKTLPDNEDPILHTINTCIKNISNQKVLDYLLTTLVAPYLKESGKYEEAYNLFIAHCHDDHIVKITTEKFANYQKTKKGNPSPKFVDYENCAGKTISLDDFKGKYVYIDIWATWCVPCRKEIPALKKLEKKYHGKNIEFVSISIDDLKNKEVWKKTVKEEQLSGTQLLADNAGQSQFLQDFDVTAVPRFILIDTEGKIIDAKAPYPSSPEIETLLNSLF